MLGELVSAGASLLGGLFGDDDAEKARAQQTDLAKNSIKYRVADAKQSGIHPLYALGAPTLSASAVTSPMGQSIANAGEHLGRAISSNYEKELKAKNLENIQADIDLKKAQSLNFIADAKNASNLARSNQVGRPAGNPNALTVAGEKVKPSKNWSDTQDVEDRYGDLVSWFYGLGTLIGDGKEYFQENMARSRANAYKPPKRRKAHHYRY